MSKRPESYLSTKPDWKQVFLIQSKSRGSANTLHMYGLLEKVQNPRTRLQIVSLSVVTTTLYPRLDLSALEPHISTLATREELNVICAIHVDTRRIYRCTNKSQRLQLPHKGSNFYIYRYKANYMELPPQKLQTRGCEYRRLTTSSIQI